MKWSHDIPPGRHYVSSPKIKDFAQIWCPIDGLHKGHCIKCPPMGGRWMNCSVNNAVCAQTGKRIPHCKQKLLLAYVVLFIIMIWFDYSIFDSSPWHFLQWPDWPELLNFKLPQFPRMLFHTVPVCSIPAQKYHELILSVISHIKY